MSKIKFLSIIKLLILIVAFALFQSCAPNGKLNISEWRGPNRSGIYNETNLLNEWPENGPDLLWVYEGIGKGYGAPSVLNGKIFVNGEQDSLGFLFAFDIEGNLL